MVRNKIAVISFDHWNYDKHIVNALQKKGVDAVHINIGQYKHANLWEQLKNTFSKIFLNKNPKKEKRQKFILETLEKIGKQDQILVINPELIDKSYHLEIKKHTSRYLAYLYDSVARCPVEHLLVGVFDAVFSFDSDDIQKYNLIKTSNYIYLDRKPLSTETPKFEAFYLASYDNRLSFLYQIVKKLNEIKVSYLFIIVGKKTWKKKWSAAFQINAKSNAIQYRRKRIKQVEMGNYYAQTNIIFDLVRENQNGLSFRIFEAMAYQKKIITSNSSIVNYDFYNPNNIFVIHETDLKFDPAFFKTPYQPIPNEIYNRYTLDYWVNIVFGI